MILTLIAFLLILSVLVLIHEAGHYFVAKKFGIKVEEFGFGLPLTKAIYSFKRGETIYSIYPALIGGFVKLYGEDEAGSGKVSVSDQSSLHQAKDVHRAFFSRSLGQRASVVVAGVVMNTILAVAIYYIFMVMSSFHTELPMIGNFHFFLVDQSVKSQVIVDSIEKNSPAAQAHIAPFSQITAINGQPVSDVKTFSQEVKSYGGKTITLSWKNIETGKTYLAEVTPRSNPGKNQGALGVSIFSADTVVLSYDTPVQKLLSGITHPANLMAYNFHVLGSLIGISVKEKNVAPLSQSVSGPVGIYSLVGTIVHIPDMKERMLETLNLTGLLSISLAFFNVLPIPGLDGGRLFFIIIEAVTRKKLNPKVEGYANAVGMAILIGLILLITVKDIFQQIGK
jgi:regulator of sigma E protease